MAHCATGPDYGFLRQSLQPRGTIALRADDQPSTGKRTYATLTDQAGICVDGSALSRRGWVFQERLLSKKVIHFATGNIMCETLGSLDANYCRDRSIPLIGVKKALFQSSPITELQSY
ncbi:hypothetical protein OQA88_8969 [Cercophora sp. LCS_1]